MRMRKEEYQPDISRVFMFTIGLIFTPGLELSFTTHAWFWVICNPKIQGLPSCVPTAFPPTKHHALFNIIALLKPEITLFTYFALTTSAIRTGGDASLFTQIPF